MKDKDKRALRGSTLYLCSAMEGRRASLPQGPAKRVQGVDFIRAAGCGLKWHVTCSLEAAIAEMLRPLPPLAVSSASHK